MINIIVVSIHRVGKTVEKQQQQKQTNKQTNK